MLAGKQITLTISSTDRIKLYNQLRTIKSRYDVKYKELTGESVTGVEVIRFDVDTQNESKVTFYVGARKHQTRIAYTILETKDRE